MSKNDNVTKVVKAKLCCSCGLCASYCCKNAISYKIDKLGFYFPSVNEDACINCGLCFKACPGISDLRSYDEHDEIYCYGYSSESEMRQNASSGGVMTELLCYLIENKIVDYVTCVTTRTLESPASQILTNDIKMIREARTSKYCPVKWNDVVYQIEHVKGNVAVVALPCQINSLKKYYANRSHNIKFFISLLCNHTPSLYAAHFLAHSIDKRAKLVSILNRGGGFPGFMRLNLSVGNSPTVREFLFPFRRTMQAGYGRYFKNRRCILCNDPFSKNADVVMGDSYFLQDTDKQGTTFCIVRNKEIHKILGDMAKHGIICLNEGPARSVIEKSYKPLFEREEQFEYRNNLLGAFSEKVRVAGLITADSSISIKDALRFHWQIFKSSLGKHHSLWGLLAYKNHLKDLVDKDGNRNL